MSWKQDLHRPLALVDGRTLRTLGHVNAFLATVPDREFLQGDKWQKIAVLLDRAAAADNAPLTALVTDRVEGALRSSGYLSSGVERNRPRANGGGRR
jgi:hypothetical protein